MKTLGLLCWTFLAFSGVVAWGAPSTPGLQIRYDHPERFTDFRLQGQSEIETSRIFADAISGRLFKDLAKGLPETHLTMEFTDIDLAGRYEPWRGPRFFDIRFYRDFTPLRLDFRYTLTDARGKTLASGTKQVYEAYYQYYHEYEPTFVRQNPAFYELQALQAWLQGLIRQTRQAVVAAR